MNDWRASLAAHETHAARVRSGGALLEARLTRDAWTRSVLAVVGWLLA